MTRADLQNQPLLQQMKLIKLKCSRIIQLQLPSIIVESLQKREKQPHKNTNLMIINQM